MTGGVITLRGGKQKKQQLNICVFNVHSIFDRPMIAIEDTCANITVASASIAYRFAALEERASRRCLG
jgi:hypothetical protein